MQYLYYFDVEGMTDFIVVPRSHPFIMKAAEVIAQAVSFIKTGRFVHDAPSVLKSKLTSGELNESCKEVSFRW